MSVPATRPVLSYAFARQHGVIAVADATGGVVLAHKAQTSRDALLEARRVIGHAVTRETLSPELFEQRLSGLYAQADLAGASEDALGAPQDLSALADGLPRTSDLLDSSDNAPIIRLINGILQEAIRSRASDIHIEPYEERLAVRLRIDGTLSEALSLPASARARADQPG